MKNKTRTALWGYIFIAPQFVGLLVFSLIPLIISFTLGFYKWDLMSDAVFVGFRNFATQLTNDIFLKTIGNTFIFVAVIVPMGFLIALTLALCVNKVKGKLFFRVIFFAPVIMSGVAVSLMWIWMFNREFGLINYFLSLIGIPMINWLGDTKMAVISIAIVTVWSSCGYDMVIYLSGLQQIPGSLYEAAEIDGASIIQKFFKITLPMLSPTIYFMLTISIIGTFQMFDRVAVMTKGGPLNSTRTMVYDIYENAFKYSKFGNAIASSIILFIFILVLTIVQTKVSQRWVNYDSE